MIYSLIFEHHRSSPQFTCEFSAALHAMPFLNNLRCVCIGNQMPILQGNGTTIDTWPIPMLFYLGFDKAVWYLDYLYNSCF